MDWDSVCEMRRWMAVGRTSDPKAPAAGYRTDMDGGTDQWGRPVKPWLRYDDVPTPLAAVCFAPRDGLFAIDLDFRRRPLTPRFSANMAKQRLGEIRSALTALGVPAALSSSGQGMHFFAEAEPALWTRSAIWLASKSRWRKISVVAMLPALSCLGMAMATSA